MKTHVQSLIDHFLALMAGLDLGEGDVRVRRMSAHRDGLTQRILSIESARRRAYEGYLVLAVERFGHSPDDADKFARALLSHYDAMEAEAMDRTAEAIALLNKEFK